MGWGNSSNIVTTNLDNSADDPGLARADLKTALDELSAVIDGRGTASGVASLDATTKIPAAQLPDEINSSSGVNLVIAPDTGRVGIEDIINLNASGTTTLEALVTAGDVIAGDVAYCSDGDAGSPCLAVYDGTAWKRIAFGTAIATS